MGTLFRISLLCIMLFLGSVVTCFGDPPELTFSDLTLTKTGNHWAYTLENKEKPGSSLSIAKFIIHLHCKAAITNIKAPENWSIYSDTDLGQGTSLVVFEVVDKSQVSTYPAPGKTLSGFSFDSSSPALESGVDFWRYDTVNKVDGRIGESITPVFVPDDDGALHPNMVLINMQDVTMQDAHPLHYRIYFVSRRSPDIGPGHAFVIWTVYDSVGNQIDTQSFGYYSTSTSVDYASLVKGPGILINEMLKNPDGPPDVTRSFAVEVDKDTYDKTLAIEQRWASKPPEYGIIAGTDCNDFIREVGNAVGLDVSKDMFPISPHYQFPSGLVAEMADAAENVNSINSDKSTFIGTNWGSYHWGDGTGDFPGGFEYTGSYRKGRFDGSGMWKSADGTMLSGTFHGGHPEGRETLTFPGLGSAVGMFHNGKPDGLMTQTFADGTKIDLTFVAGKPDGPLVLYLDTGTGYTNYTGGQYIFDGNGRFEFKDKSKIVGTWSKNTFVTGIYTGTDGVSHRVTLVDGKYVFPDDPTGYSPPNFYVEVPIYPGTPYTPPQTWATPIVPDDPGDP